MPEGKEGILANPLVEKLMSLHLPVEDYAIFGSGPMFAHGLKDSVRDLDIIARGSAWKKATEIGKSEKTRSGFGDIVSLFGDEIEIYNDWTGGSWNINELIDTAEVIDGIRFVTLENVLKWKKLRNEPKDAEHIRLIEEYLSAH